MSLRKKIFAAIEWIVAIILLSICVYYYIFSYGSFSAIGAYRASERTMHYGPSEIKKVIDVKNGKVYLGKYKNWISAAPIEKKFIKWYPGNGGEGCPIKYSDKISQFMDCGAMGRNSYLCLVFGYVNDSNIKVVSLQIQDNKKKNTMKYKITSDKMFIFCLENNSHKYNVVSLKGLDKNGKVIYENDYK